MTDKNLLQKLPSLPPPLKSLLYSDNVGIAIKDALQLANLEEKDYFSSLMEKVVEVLTLEISLVDFSDYINSKLNITNPQKQIIEKVLKEKIFNPVLPFLKAEKIKKEKIEETEEKISFFQQKKDQLSSLLKKVQPPKLEKIKLSTIKPQEKPSPSIQKVKEQEQKQTIPLTKIEEKPEEIPPPSQISISLEQNQEPTIKTENQEPPLLEIKIPEPLDIKIEAPIQKKIEMPALSLPEKSPEKEEKIKETLLKAMTEKKIQTPKIVEEMEKVEKTPPSIKQPLPQIKKEKASAKFQEVSEIVAGQNHNFEKQAKKISPDKTKSSVLDVKIKEFEKKAKEETIKTEPIAYKKYTKEEKKPFGET